LISSISGFLALGDRELGEILSASRERLVGFLGGGVFSFKGLSEGLDLSFGGVCWGVFGGIVRSRR
jgi:hypothetical protein